MGALSSGAIRGESVNNVFTASLLALPDDAFYSPLYQVLEGLGKWVEFAALIGPGLASGIRALNRQREHRRQDGERWRRLAETVSHAR